MTLAARLRGAGSEDHPAVSPRMIIVGLLAADVTFAFQQTAIVPAVHQVEQSLGASPEWSAWLVTVYLIVATVATPALGRLADLHGRRRMLLTGLAVFMAGSAGAALAPDLPVLLLCRAVQGVGGAVYPLTLALARRLLPDERVAPAVALSAGAFGLGTMAGFAGGGLLAQYASWRWIFVAGAVLVAVGLAAVLALVPATRDQAGGGYDGRGTVALGVAAIGLLAALTLVVPLGWASPVTAGLLTLAVAAAAAWAWIEARTSDPLIDIHALLAPPVLRTNLATIGLGWALFGSYLLVPRFAQASPRTLHYGLGATTAAVGLIMLPLAAGQTAAGPLAGLASRRTSPRAVFATGLVLVAAALAWLSVIRTGLPQAVAALLILGAGAGAALASSSAVATQGVSADVAAASSALNSTIRRFAGGTGGQVSTILLASYPVVTSGRPRFAAFTVAYLVAAALCLGGTALAARLSRPGRARMHRCGRLPAGRGVRGHARAVAGVAPQEHHQCQQRDRGHEPQPPCRRPPEAGPPAADRGRIPGGDADEAPYRRAGRHLLVGGQAGEYRQHRGELRGRPRESALDGLQGLPLPLADAHHHHSRFRESLASSRSGSRFGPADPVIAALRERDLQRRVGDAVGLVAFSASLDRFLVRLEEHRLGRGARSLQRPR